MSLRQRQEVQAVPRRREGRVKRGFGSPAPPLILVFPPPITLLEPDPMPVEHFDPTAILAELRIRLDEAGRFL